MSGRRVLQSTLRVLYVLVLVLVAGYLIVPSVIITVISFSTDEFITFPPRSWGIRQYATLFRSGDWLDPFVRSLIVACIAAPMATAIGLAAVFGLNRTRVPGRNFMQIAGIGPLLAPAIAYAIALYALFASLHMLGSSWALILVHTTLAVPFVILFAGSAILSVPRELELAALSLGASRWRMWRDITLRLLLPTVIASAIFAFVVSFDEVVLASFLGYETLPVAIFHSVRYGVDPVITAIATLLTLATGLLLTSYGFLRRTR